MKRSVQLPAPRLEHLFHAEFEVGEPFRVGNTPEGILSIIPFPSGRFEGPAMRGSVIICGGDWNTLRQDRVDCIDGKYLFRSDDGAVIPVEATGAAFLTEEQYAEMSAGTAVLPGGYRFRERLLFRTGSRKYRWLNELIVLGTGGLDNDGKLHLDAWVVR